MTTATVTRSTAAARRAAEKPNAEARKARAAAQAASAVEVAETTSQTVRVGQAASERANKRPRVAQPLTCTDLIRRRVAGVEVAVARGASAQVRRITAHSGRVGGVSKHPPGKRRIAAVTNGLAHYEFETSTLERLLGPHLLSTEL